MAQKSDIYQTVTDQIIAAIETGLKGKVELPWHGVSTLPQNARTGNSYHGVNVPLLWVHQLAQGYKSAVWATYRQWQDMGAQVKKGEKGVQVVFWKSVEIEPEDDHQEAETRMFARYSVVFNAGQVDGYEPKTDFVPSDIKSIGAADALIEATGADIRHEDLRAYYHVAGDYINLPCPEFFKETKGSSATENYYSVLFHELTHWSGAKHRLDRLHSSKFGDTDYAFEELVAELGSAYLCASTGIESVSRDDHALYIQNWLEALRSDKKFIFAASSQAQKAVDYLFSFMEQVEAA
ncbi:MAG: DUF1738 domain-containing protein [Bdellovibrionales bacterium]|nr:DUF1738 domain-containing protein [Bdellovibrionales bacterium]